MAVFLNNAITDSGTKLLAQIQTGAVFIPTRMVMGSGELPSGKSVKTVTEVVSPEQEFPVSEVEKTPDESAAMISGIFSNKTVTESFYYRELGLYAKGVFEDGTETEEVLYSYGNVGSNPDLIPAYSTETFIELILRLVVYVGNNAEVKLEVKSEAYVSSETFNEVVANLQQAQNINYDNTESGIEAENVQAAIDELESNVVTLDGVQSITGQKTFTAATTIGTRKSGSTMGAYSFAQGNNLEASGKYSCALGLSTVASGTHAYAEGESNTASGYDSHAEGVGGTASGTASHVEGGFNSNIGFSVASGYAAHAEGISTTASQSASHAEGNVTTASGYYSHAEGCETTASGMASHAEGGYTTASGIYSHAEGYYTTALGMQHAQGHFNNTVTAPGSNYSGATDYTAFVIGNGTESAASNAFRVTYRGVPYAKSALTTTGCDYAEYFEWLDGNPDSEDRRGYFVTLDGNKIKIAEPDDYILGIVSGQPSIIGNGDEDWMGRYVFDEFGAFVYEEFEYEEELYDGETQETKTVTKTGTKYKENPDYDPSKGYIQREDRPEWSAIGMLGLLSVRDDGTCKVNGYCKVADGGTATAADSGYRVINRVNDNIVKVIFR